MRTVFSVNPSEAWLKSLELVSLEGKGIGGIIESENLVNYIQNPIRIDARIEEVHDQFALATSVKRAKFLMLRKGTRRGKATYYERLTNWDGRTNQINKVVERISEKPNSKHLSCCIIDPSVDWKKRGFMPSQPCLLAIDFRLRHNLLNLTAFFRSQDMLNVAYTDFKALGDYLRIVADRLRSLKDNHKFTGIRIGNAVCHTTSAFIYARDKQKAIKALKNFKDRSGSIVSPALGKASIEKRD